MTRGGMPAPQYQRPAAALGLLSMTLLYVARPLARQRDRPTNDALQGRHAPAVGGDGFVVAVAQVHHAALRLDQRQEGNLARDVGGLRRLDVLLCGAQDLALVELHGARA